MNAKSDDDADLSADRATFSAPPEIMKKARQKAKKMKQKFSNYIAEVITADVQNEAEQPSVLSPDVLVELTRRACGELMAADLATALADANQPEALRDLLHAFARTKWLEYVKRQRAEHGEHWYQRRGGQIMKNVAPEIRNQKEG